MSKEWYRKRDLLANFRTVTLVGKVPTETLIDGGACLSSTSEESVVIAINGALAQGMKPGKPGWPVLALEYWGRAEQIRGVLLVLARFS